MEQGKYEFTINRLERKEIGLKLASISCLDDCDWVRWFTAEDLKRHRKNQKKLNKERNKQ